MEHSSCKASQERVPESRSDSRGPVGHGSPVRVVIADDHPIVRSGVRSILERSHVAEVIGEAGDGQTLMDRAEALRPDVVVMDVSMPDLNGIDATRLLRKRYPNTRVVVFSVHCTEDAVVSAIEAGATGYVLKETAAEDLCHAVQLIAAGQAYFSPAAAALVARQLRGGGKSTPRLTAREREVVQLLAEGCALREVAKRLFVSPRTVKSHRASAMRKLGAHTTADLVRHAIRTGLASL